MEGAVGFTTAGFGAVALGVGFSLATVLLEAEALLEALEEADAAEEESAALALGVADVVVATEAEALADALGLLLALADSELAVGSGLEQATTVIEAAMKTAARLAIGIISSAPVRPAGCALAQNGHDDSLGRMWRRQDSQRTKAMSNLEAQKICDIESYRVRPQSSNRISRANKDSWEVSACRSLPWRILLAGACRSRRRRGTWTAARDPPMPCGS